MKYIDGPYALSHVLISLINRKLQGNYWKSLGPRFPLSDSGAFLGFPVNLEILDELLAIFLYHSGCIGPPEEDCKGLRGGGIIYTRKNGYRKDRLFGHWCE